MGDGETRFHGCPTQLRLLRCGVLAGRAGQDHYEFIAAHSCDVVVLAAATTETAGDFLKYAVSSEVSKSIIHLLEPIEIGDQDGNIAARSSSSGQFAIELYEQRSRIWQPGKIIRRCAALR